MTIAVGVAVPLISAAIAALIAWVVALRQNKGAREAWVLDKRHKVYEQVVDTILGVIGDSGRPAAAGQEAMLRPSQRGALLVSLRRVHLVAPAAVIRATNHAYGFCHPDADPQQLVNALNALMDAMREDLVPEHMR